MKKEGYSRPGLFGTMKHYDANGNKIGESRQGFFGSMNNYDANGHKVGHSSPGLFGTMNHYDNSLDSRINMTRLVPQLRVLHKSQPA